MTAHNFAEQTITERARLAATDPVGELEAVSPIDLERAKAWRAGLDDSVRRAGFDDPEDYLSAMAPTSLNALGEQIMRDAETEAMSQSGARRLSDIDRSAAPPLLLDRLDPAGHTILHGTGGVGKGTLATWWIGQLVRQGGRVLILDYENHPEEWARRYFGLFGLDGLDRVFHVAPLTDAFHGRHGPIWDSVLDISELMDNLATTYVVVDSIVTACGGADPMEPGTPARYAGALQAIGGPFLSLAHVTKADDLRYPFGSIFWHNLARVTWSLAKDGERLMLTNRKANNYANQGRTLLSVTWQDDLPREVSEQPYNAVLADRIDELLGLEGLPVTTIVKRLNEDGDEEELAVKADSVRKALRRGVRADPKRYTVTGVGDSAIWAKA